LSENYGKYFGTVFANLIEELVAEESDLSKYSLNKLKAMLDSNDARLSELRKTPNEKNRSAMERLEKRHQAIMAAIAKKAGW
jgi:hypothetical protein